MVPEGSIYCIGYIYIYIGAELVPSAKVPTTGGACAEVQVTPFAMRLVQNTRRHRGASQCIYERCSERWEVAFSLSERIG